jgi:HAD superfamily hydrolase (TIGR01509 family)
MKLQIPVGDFRAYLFDCDGTIADSMPLHYIAWRKALEEWNCPFDEQLFYAWGGRPPVDVVVELNRMHGLKMPVESVDAQREKFYREFLPRLQPVAEVLEHIDAMHRQIPFAVVSGSKRESVISSLTAVGLLDKFDLIVGSEDYTLGKPAPDAFLTAAERLGVAPAHCLVFEDTDFGIQAATAAGMASVRVPSPLERKSENKPR